MPLWVEISPWKSYLRIKFFEVAFPEFWFADILQLISCLQQPATSTATFLAPLQLPQYNKSKHYRGAGRYTLISIHNFKVEGAGVMKLLYK